MTQRVEMLRQQFGAWRVIWLAEPGYDGRHATWVCRCECGEVEIRRGDSLRARTTTSCGCMGHEAALELEARRRASDETARLEAIEIAEAIGLYEINERAAA